MPANVDPIYTRKPTNQWTGLLTAANTATDGTGTVATVFTADATNGSFLQRVRFKTGATNVQTVARIFLNNGQSNATAANNVLLDEVTLPATTASATQGLPAIEVPMNIPIPPGYKILVTLGTAVAGGWYATGVGGDY